MGYEKDAWNQLQLMQLIPWDDYFSPAKANEGFYSALLKAQTRHKPLEKEDKLIRIRKDKLLNTLDEVLPLQFNLLTQRIENAGEPVDGDFLNTLHLQLAERYKFDLRRDLAADAAVILAKRHSYHPVKSYLESLTSGLTKEEWESLAFFCFRHEDATATLHLQRQLIGLVARTLQPGCDFHTALVLHSDKQGIGKSQFWKILGGIWFSDSLGDLKNLKEDTLQLHSAWIHEWGEIDRVLGVRMSETLKGFLSRSWDDVRKPYGRGYEQLKRRSGIVGTTNRRDFIKDFTGNRRFPIITIKKVELEWVKENRAKIWYSALEAYKSSVPWHYTEEENALITSKAQEYAALDPLKEQLETWLDENPEIDEIPVAYALVGMGLEDEIRDQKICIAMARHFQSLGWQRNPKRQRHCLPNGIRTDKTSSWIRQKNF